MFGATRISPRSVGIRPDEIRCRLDCLSLVMMSRNDAVWAASSASPLADGSFDVALIALSAEPRPTSTTRAFAASARAILSAVQLASMPCAAPNTATQRSAPPSYRKASVTSSSELTGSGAERCGAVLWRMASSAAVTREVTASDGGGGACRSGTPPMGAAKSSLVSTKPIAITSVVRVAISTAGTFFG